MSGESQEGPEQRNNLILGSNRTLLATAWTGRHVQRLLPKPRWVMGGEKWLILDAVRSWSHGSDVEE